MYAALRSFVSSSTCCFDGEGDGNVEGDGDVQKDQRVSVRLAEVRRECRELQELVAAPTLMPEPIVAVHTCLFCRGAVVQEQKKQRTVVAKCGHVAALCSQCAIGTRPRLTLTECNACVLNYYEA